MNPPETSPLPCFLGSQLGPEGSLAQIFLDLE
jgi:hypothetical protein